MSTESSDWLKVVGRTKPYKEHLRESLKTTDDYVGYLRACHDEGPETFTLAVQDVLEFAATSMRSACVEKVREIGDEVLAEFAAEFKPDGRSFSVLKREAVIKFLRKLKPALESLSIEQPKE